MHDVYCLILKNEHQNHSEERNFFFELHIDRRLHFVDVCVRDLGYPGDNTLKLNFEGKKAEIQLRINVSWTSVCES